MTVLVTTTATILLETNNVMRVGTILLQTVLRFALPQMTPQGITTVIVTAAKSCVWMDGLEIIARSVSMMTLCNDH